MTSPTSQPSQESHDETCFLAMGGGGLCNCSLSKDPAEEPAEPSEGGKDLEPVREDAHRSPSGSERIYRTPSGLHLRLLKIGEAIRAGDFTWTKAGSVELRDPLPILMDEGLDVRATDGNYYYRPIQGAAEGEALPEAPAEGSPSDLIVMGLPSAPSVTMGGDKDALIAEAVAALGDIASWSIPRKRLGAALEHIHGVAMAALSKLEGR